MAGRIPSEAGVHGGGTDPTTRDRVLLAIADHLHEHCTCELLDPNERCDACEVRAILHGVREELLAWRAHGRRLVQRRDEALASAGAQLARRRAACDECAGLAGLSTSTVEVGS